MSTIAGSVGAQDAPASRRPTIPVATLTWLSVLIVICYAPVLKHLIEQWIGDEDMGHAFFVPVLAGYIAWQSRERLLSRPLRPSYWGLALVVWSGLQLMLATLGAELFLARTALVFSIIGSVWYLGGTYALRVFAFPLVLLFFMVPIPAVIYGQITLPLQMFASWVGEGALSLMGIPVLREGNVLELASQKLSVVEACSGIRSLLSLSFLSLVYGYFFDSRRWIRWFLFAATIPIAIVANAGRATITGLLSEWNPEYARGFFHSASGWVIFMIALVILIAVHRSVDWAAKSRFLRKGASV